MDPTGKGVLSEDYDKASEKSGWDSPERAQKLVDRYITDGSTVLDVGVGTGKAVKGYAEKGATIIGLDYDSEMLAKAQEVTGESGLMVEADINGQWPIGEAKVDVVQVIGAFEFANDLGEAMNQVKLCLRSDGVFVFTVETPASSADAMVQHYPDDNLTIHRHTADEVRGLLRDKDFNLLSDESYGGYERGDMTEKVPYHIFLAQNK